MKEPANKAAFAFRWKYVLLPLLILLLSVIVTAIFYPRLSFPVAYHFQSDGTADRFAISGLLVLGVLVPQFLLAFGALAFNWLIAMLGARFLNAGEAVVSPQRIMLFTGNMVVLPQIIIFYFMIDIFIVNVSHIHLPIPTLAFALTVMALGGVVLGIFFIQAMMQVIASNKLPAKK